MQNTRPGRPRTALVFSTETKGLNDLTAQRAHARRIEMMRRAADRKAEADWLARLDADDDGSGHDYRSGLI